MTDLGVYECRVKNILDEEEAASAYLNVQCEFKNIHELQIIQSFKQISLDFFATSM